MTESLERLSAPLTPDTRHAAAMRAARLPALLLLSTVAVLPRRVSAQLPLTAPSASTAADSGARRISRHAEVTFSNGLLTVQATNASLNSLLREIARQTGMKITGTAAEDRVFGSYGPDDPQRVLATLLDGTGTNILIQSNAADAPLQLVLTPRTGAPTPPNPNEAMARNDDADDVDPPAAQVNAITAPRPRQPVIPGSVPQPAPQPGSQTPGPAAIPVDPAATQPSSTSQQLVFPAVDATSTPATATTTPVDPNNTTDPSTNTVKTPQQIFEQLQRLRQGRTDGTQTTSPR